MLRRFDLQTGKLLSVSDGFPLMISGSALGHLAVWNLSTRRLVSQKENAHAGSITGLNCFANQPLLVTSSPDNSIRIWIMDDELSGIRLHKFKEGHTGPPTRVRFYGDGGKTILSAGKDSSIRSFSLEADFLNFSLGRAAFNDKKVKKGKTKLKELMPVVTDFYAEPTREAEWDNIVAVHEGLKQVTTWSYHRKTRGSHFLLHERFQKDITVVPTVSSRLINVLKFEVRSWKI